MLNDPDLQRRSALAAAWDAEQAKAERYAPRIDGFTDREYREHIQDSLRNGSMTPQEAMGYVDLLDAEAAQRGELKPWRPRDDRELALHEAYRAQEVATALAAGQLPPPATEFATQDGRTPMMRTRIGRSAPAATEPARRKLLAHEQRRQDLETIAGWLPDYPERETAAEYAASVERIERGEATLRDVLDGAYEIHGGEPPESAEAQPTHSTGGSVRSALEAAWDAEYNLTNSTDEE